MKRHFIGYKHFCIDYMLMVVSVSVDEVSELFNQRCTY